MVRTQNLNGFTITDLIAHDSRFTKFDETIKTAGLDGTLAGDKEFTVLAPTDEAFARLAQNELARLLSPESRVELRRLMRLHILPAKFLAEDLERIAAIRTYGGQDINITVSPDFKAIKVGNANVMLPKVEAKNGLIYALDGVLQPITTAAFVT